MRYFRTIIFLLALFTGLTGAHQSAAQTQWSSYADTFLSLVNEARANPLEAAKAMGLDTDKVLMDLPELKDILVNGLPALKMNDRLKAAASGHTSEMAAYGFYSHLSRDGRTWEKRILDAGYLASHSGEALGLVSFNNYLQPSVAVEWLFRNIFMDELRPERTEMRNILSADMEEVGIAMGSGLLVVGGSRFNAYMVTCDFAKSGASELEDMFLDLVNWARKSPLEAALSIGLDPEELVSSLPGLSDVLKNGLPPLEVNALLKKASRAWMDEVAEQGFVADDSTEAVSAEERAAAQGYLPAAGAGAMVAAPADGFSSAADALNEIFTAMFTAELSPAFEGRRLILAQELRDASVSVAMESLAPGAGEVRRLSLAVAILACADAGPAVENRLVLLINKARSDPLEAVRGAGFDPENLPEGLRWVKDIAAGGLQPLWPNERLRSVALAHTLDMADRHYFSGVSPEGVEGPERIASAGYDAASTAEALAEVGFLSTDPEVIAGELLKVMIAEELDASVSGTRLIFNQDITEVGLGVGGAAFSLGGISGASAVLVAEGAGRMSGESPREAAEMLFLELVNEARANPIGMATAVGMAPDAIMAALRGWGGTTLHGMESVFVNEELWAAARDHTDDMAERGYFSHITLPDGADPTSDIAPLPGGPFRPGSFGVGYRDRMIRVGYVPMVCGEFLGVVDLSNEAFPEKAIVSMFVERFMLEMTPGSPEERLILNPSYQEIGIGLGIGEIATGGEVKSAWVLTVDFATSYEGVSGAVFGLSY